MKIIQRITFQCKNFLQFIQKSKAASKIYGTGFWPVFQRGLYIRTKNKFSFDEIFLLGLADPNQPLKNLKKTISRRSLFKFQKTDNHPRYTGLTEDKSIFYVFCSGAGIPIPKFFGVYNPLAGRSASGKVLYTNEDWHTFFLKEISESFVVKPARGVYGRGVSFFKRDQTNGCFTDGDGKSYDVKGLRQQIIHDPRFQNYVVQERIMNHPSISDLSDTEALQTIRIVTYIDEMLRPEILFADLKIVNGNDNLSDNFDSGHSGNLLAKVNLENGMLKTVLGKADHGYGFEEYRSHPKSGVNFKGFYIPYWADVLQLAEELALKFRPLSSIGWDIAITAAGPIVIEGNMWWDPHNERLEMKHYLKVRN